MILLVAVSVDEMLRHFDDADVHRPSVFREHGRLYLDGLLLLLQLAGFGVGKELGQGFALDAVGAEDDPLPVGIVI